jgi:hypothetical protein
MKTATLLIAGLLLGCLFGRRRALGPDLCVESDELATPSLFRRTVKLHYRPVSPVSKGVAQSSV